MGILDNRIGLVFGVANKRSIAWAIAQAWHAAGARLAFTYQGARLKENVEELAGTFGPDTLILPCDVTSDDQIAAVFSEVGSKLGRLDLLLHSVAYAPKEALEGKFINTTREGFKMAHDISAYSLVALARGAEPLMANGGSIVAMSYYGAEKVIPNYNVMGVAKAALEASVRYLAADLGPQGVRVNAISPGPMRTLAGAVIGGARYVYRVSRDAAPLRRNVELSDVGGAALYYLSDLSAGVTGTVHFVDSGYHAIGLPHDGSAAPSASGES